MSIFRKPSELEAKPGIVAMIYGSPGSGKSTLACSAPNAVMIDTDGGVMRINGAHQIPTLQVKCWEEILTAMNEVRTTPEIESVIIDTVGKMLAFMEDYIKRSATGRRIELNADGSLSLKGYGKRKQMFIDFIKGITMLGKNVIFVGHDREETRGNETVIRPEVGGSSTNDLMRELDLVGYIQMNGNERTISFTPTDKYYAKNTCDMPGVITIPVLINDRKEIIGDNRFFGDVIEAYRRRVSENIENNRRLEELKGLMEANIADIGTAEDANRVVDWVQGLKHIYNSKAIAGRMIADKARELGLTFDKATKKYIDGGTQD
ncbi:MAG: ATP-binding protein [Bacteroides sp.]|nr:ATP-binding protein [Bacteroides sp.]